MEAFIDKTRAVDGFIVVSRTVAQGYPIHRLGWVYTWKNVDDQPQERARGVFEFHPSMGGFESLTFSGTSKPLCWKTVLHCGVKDGAMVFRADIENAHQSTRFGPDDPPCFSYPFPGCPVRTADGEEGLLKWTNMLNGMPIVGRAFSHDLAGHMSRFDPVQDDAEMLDTTAMRSTLLDPHTWTWRRSRDIYILACVIVDDLLLVVKGGESIVDLWWQHMSQQWKLKRLPIDGFLNNEIYWLCDGRIVLICMATRIAEMMHEHLPEEMENTEWPPTPCHPKLQQLLLGDGSCPASVAQSGSRLGAQEIYVVHNIYFSAQYPVFYAMRFSSKPTPLWLECLQHTLRWLYANRWHGLAVGDVDEDENYQVASHADAGLAEPGPSTGGHTLDVGKVTVHAISGQHHATTLGTTDAEMYEVSRAAATLVGYAEFVQELGFEQVGPPDLHCDNDGTCLKAESAASDKRSLYMKRRVDYVATAQAHEQLYVQAIDSSKNRADVLTKALKLPLFPIMHRWIQNISTKVERAVATLARSSKRC